MLKQSFLLLSGSSALIFSGLISKPAYSATLSCPLLTCYTETVNGFTLKFTWDGMNPGAKETLDIKNPQGVAPALWKPVVELSTIVGQNPIILTTTARHISRVHTPPLIVVDNAQGELLTQVNNDLANLPVGNNRNLFAPASEFTVDHKTNVENSPHFDIYTFKYNKAAGQNAVSFTFSGRHSVPEPLTLLGAGTALGFGTFFKRKLSPSKSAKKETTKVG